MKHIQCSIIQDLLPLYVDDCCSDVSRQAVEQHLEICTDCRVVLHEISTPLPHVATTPAQPEEKTAPTLKKGLKKIRRRWIASILIVIALIPVCFLGWNQAWGHGVCFTNLRELWIADRFLNCLQQGNYEGAYAYIDLESLRADWLSRSFDEETLANMETDGRAQFCESAADLISAGGIRAYQYLATDRQPEWHEIFFSVVIGEKTHKITLCVSDDGVQALGGFSIPPSDPIDALAMWSELLWQHYEGCYFDPELGKYVYDSTG